MSVDSKIQSINLLLAFLLPVAASGAEVAREATHDDQFVDLTPETAERARTMRSLLKTPIASYGPNCWNTALLASGLTDSIRYTSGAEFWHWMNSPFCEAVPADEPLRFGDIGSVFSSEGSHFHSFMRINDGLMFQKAGPKHVQKWEITNYEKIVYPQFYEEALRCRGNEGKQDRANCRIRVTYTRCRPLPRGFFSRHADLGQLEAEIKKAEGLAQPWILRHSPEERKNFELSLTSLGSIFKKLEGMRFFGEKEFARKALMYRVAGTMTIDSTEKLSGSTNALVIEKAMLFNSQQVDRTLSNTYASVDRSTWRSFPQGADDSAPGLDLFNLQSPGSEVLSGRRSRAPSPLSGNLTGHSDQ